MPAALVKAMKRALVSCPPARAKTWPSDPRRVINTVVKPKILIIQLDSIGDNVLTTAMISPLHAAYPHLTVDVLTSKAAAPIYKNLEGIGEIWVKPQMTTWKDRLEMLAFLRNCIWKQRYLFAVNPRWDHDYYGGDRFALLSCIPHRIAFSKVGALTSASEECNYSRQITSPNIVHELEHRVEMLEALGVSVAAPIRTMIQITPEERLRARGRFTLQRASLVVSVGIGAQEGKRQWPPERWAELLRGLNQAQKIGVILVGSANDRGQVEAICQRLGSIPAQDTVDLPLRDSMALMELADIHIGNDSGPMHIAAALGLPTVEFSCHPSGGSNASANSPQRFGPRGVPHRILQPNAAASECNWECMSKLPHCILGISVDRGLASTLELLASCGARREYSGVW